MGEIRLAPTTGALSAALGDEWLPTIQTNNLNDDPMFVFRHATRKQEMRIVRPHPVWPAGTPIDLPNIGTMQLYNVLDDPAIAVLRDVLVEYAEYDILRYRPGKRITIAAYDPRHANVIIKCVANGVNKIVKNLYALSIARDELQFRIGAAFAKHQSTSVFMQQRIDGIEPDLKGISSGTSLAGKMARAISSLHESNVAFATNFGIDEQSARSQRYLNIIKRKFPDIEPLADALEIDLKSRGQAIRHDARPYVPIHGSLHSHQWLIARGELGLVDFDRAAMGHAELDIATFVAEWDYEPGTISEAVKQKFLAGLPPFDELLMNYYRAHKHLAKAFKAAKHIDHAIAAVKCRRNLHNARALLG